MQGDIDKSNIIVRGLNTLSETDKSVGKKISKGITELNGTQPTGHNWNLQNTSKTINWE